VSRAEPRAVDLGPNDVLRFGLELGALAALAVWAWTGFGGPTRYVLTVGLPLLAAALWGTFRVPNDPGPAPVAVPGAVRLAMEWLLFGLAAAALWTAGRPLLGVGFAVVTAGHYVLARERVRWLLGQ